MLETCDIWLQAKVIKNPYNHEYSYSIGWLSRAFALGRVCKLNPSHAGDVNRFWIESGVGYKNYSEQYDYINKLTNTIIFEPRNRDHGNAKVLEVLEVLKSRINKAILANE